MRIFRNFQFEIFHGRALPVGSQFKWSESCCHTPPHQHNCLNDLKSSAFLLKLGLSSRLCSSFTKTHQFKTHKTTGICTLNAYLRKNRITMDIYIIWWTWRFKEKYWYQTNYVMIVSEFLKHFYSCWLTSCKHYLNLSQKNTKQCKKSCFQKGCLKFSISILPQLWEFAEHGAQCLKCSHSMIICTLESSLNPFFCSHFDHPPLLSHSILFMSKDPGNTTSVSALICTIYTRGRRIYTHTSKWPCFQQTFHIT